MPDPRNRTHDEIRRRGGVGNLNEGIEIPLHGLATRLIAWPGNGFQTESVHVVTHRPGEESDRYTYATGEEAAVCLHGRGEVWLHDRWVAMAAGDLAFWPQGVAHATRNAPGSERDFVLVTQLTPPPFHLYEPAGFYDRAAGAMRFEVIERARRAANPGSLSTAVELRLREGEEDVRAWNLGVETIRTRGALFNIFRGAAIDSLGVSMLLVLWPGHGPRSSGFNFGPIDPGGPGQRHTHPVSDECVVCWDGDHADFELEGQLVRLHRHDVLLAPCGVEHGGGPTEEQGRIWLGGFASPPRLDLLLKSGLYDGERFATPTWSELDVPGWSSPRG
ncbi:cupin domain-containing protein [Conexibacter woesei]|uniref:Cupin 2 conserved barrel domain protein n=1 Tax=Conexibacter woesei (strain DSM 14684 / CCUG 47730 / CIP 108061 / JCM 11494 / NBRC 100937 / ID131577) TaxID=469383 RepID=D3F3H8_CONWI|nr:cupin domain-containing protein [Conexibacter woesei]ADB52343.1 Cupin 2 conserved barrel domain protein [Conexibacter woesei DSM 14684]